MEKGIIAGIERANLCRTGVLLLDVFLDIGFTLMGGPSLSPPKKLTQILNLDVSYGKILSKIAFSEPHYTPTTLISSIEDALALKVTDQQRDAINAFWADQHTDVYEIDGARELFESLIVNQFRIHIVSNLWFPFYDKFRKVFHKNLTYINSETLSFKEGITKPSPEFFRIALERSGAIPATSIMIGDSFDNDIFPCAELGMKCIWFISRPLNTDILTDNRAQLAKFKDVFEIYSLYEAKSIIERKLSNERSESESTANHQS